MVLDNRAPRSFNDNWLHFFISVNYTLGAHILIWLTGTKGMLANKDYKASAAPAPPPRPAEPARAMFRRCRRAAQARHSCWVGQCSKG